MFEFSLGELLVVSVVGLIVLGPEELTRVAKQARRLWKQARLYTTSMQHHVTALLDESELARPITIIEGEDGTRYEAYDVSEILSQDASRAEIIPFERKQ